MAGFFTHNSPQNPILVEPMDDLREGIVESLLVFNVSADLCLSSSQEEVCRSKDDRAINGSVGTLLHRLFSYI